MRVCAVIIYERRVRDHGNRVKTVRRLSPGGRRAIGERLRFVFTAFLRRSRRRRSGRPPPPPEREGRIRYLLVGDNVRRIGEKVLIDKSVAAITLIVDTSAGIRDTSLIPVLIGLENEICKSPV